MFYHRLSFLGRPLLALAALALALVLSTGAQAAFPDHPLTLVVPYPPGGATGTLGRIVADGLAKRLGQAVVVDNRGGAGTTLGAGLVAQAAPTGYTLLISSSSTYTLNPALRNKLPYDPLASFDPIGTIGSTPLVLIASPTLAANSVAQVVALAKAQPGKLSYASFGVGTSPHFAGEMFKAVAGVDMVHVPYRGEAPAIQDVMSGQVPLSFSTNLTAMPQIQAGKVKAIAVTSARPSPSMPGIPTIAQSGYPGYEMVPWYAVVAPHGVPPAVLKVLVKALDDTIADPAIRQALQQAGLDVAYEPPSAYAARINRELPRMRAYVQRAGMQID